MFVRKNKQEGKKIFQYKPQTLYGCCEKMPGWEKVRGTHKIKRTRVWFKRGFYQGGENCLTQLFMGIEVLQCLKKITSKPLGKIDMCTLFFKIFFLLFFVSTAK